MTYSLSPLTLDELRERFGDGAAYMARASAIRLWMMNLGASAHEDGTIANAYRVAAVACDLVSEDELSRLGYPRSNGRPYTSSLSALSTESQAEARRVAAETEADWERAGTPGMNRDRFKGIASYLLAVRANAA